MGRALGIPDSGLLLPTTTVQDIDMNEPLGKLLLNKRFRQSFMAFADRFVLFLNFLDSDVYLSCMCLCVGL